MCLGSKYAARRSWESDCPHDNLSYASVITGHPDWWRDYADWPAATPEAQAHWKL